jgi:RNA polymerase sigma-70 factor (sigma-E family)
VASYRDVEGRGGFDEFAASALPGLLRYAVMLTGDRELSRDLVQDVLIKMHSAWSRLGDVDRLDLYARTAVTRSFISWRRRWSVRHVFVTFDGSIEDSFGSSGSDPAASIVDRDEAWRLLAGLPAKQRAVLALRYYQNLSDDEIADVLGCSSGTVRGYASRALAALRQRLSAADESTVASDNDGLPTVDLSTGALSEEMP